MAVPPDRPGNDGADSDLPSTIEPSDLTAPDIFDNKTLDPTAPDSDIPDPTAQDSDDIPLAPTPPKEAAIEDDLLSSPHNKTLDPTAPDSDIPDPTAQDSDDIPVAPTPPKEPAIEDYLLSSPHNNNNGFSPDPREVPFPLKIRCRSRPGSSRNISARTHDYILYPFSDASDISKYRQFVLNASVGTDDASLYSFSDHSEFSSRLRCFNAGEDTPTSDLSSSWTSDFGSNISHVSNRTLGSNVSTLGSKSSNDSGPAPGVVIKGGVDKVTMLAALSVIVGGYEFSSGILNILYEFVLSLHGRGFKLWQIALITPGVMTIFCVIAWIITYLVMNYVRQP